MAIINGTPGDDRSENGLFGTEGDDTIFGFEGRDDLTGEAGNDTLDGGEGDRDQARYDSAPGPVTGNLTTGVVSDGFGGTDTLINIEEIRGSNFADTLTGAESGEVRLNGRGGDDTLIGNNSSDEGGTDLDGGDGNDTLISIGGDFSFMQPGTGNDTITGSSNFDTISYFFSAGYDDPPAIQGVAVTFSDEGAGTVIDYRGDTDTFTGIERVEGTMLADTFTGAAGFQSFSGTGGNDTIDGGEGDDEINYNSTRDDFATESGVIVDLEAGTSTDKFGDTDTLISIEQVRGSDFADQIKGDGQNNRLRGEEGDDTLEGGAGDDQLRGDVGVDTAVFEGDQSNYSLSISSNEITITDRRVDGQGSDELRDIEILDFGTELAIFGDGPMSLDTFDDAASLSASEFSSIVELYIAYFNRAPDAIGLNFWASSFARGEVDVAQMAELFFDQPETRAAYTDVLDATGSQISDIPAFVTAVYSNVLGRAFDEEGRDFWVGALESGGITTGAFIGEIIKGAKADPASDASQDFIDQQLVDQQYLADKTDVGVHFAVINGMSDTDNAAATMSLFTGSQESINAAVDESNQFLVAAESSSDGEFLMPLVGVLDDPFGVA